MPVTLSPGERELLETLVSKGLVSGWRMTTAELAERIGMDRSRVEALSRLLVEKGVFKLVEEEFLECRLTDEGRESLDKGLPEERLVKLLEERGGEAAIEEVRRELGSLYGPAIGNAARRGWVRIEAGRVKLLARGEAVDERRVLEEVARSGRIPPGLESVAKELARRKQIVCEKKRVAILEPTRPLDEVLREAVVEVGALTRELIESGAWRKVRLRRYNLKAEPPRRYPGRLHFYVEFLEMLRDVMREMGFVEYEGPLVELEFWNFDALYQAQDHPAREIHDTFRVEKPAAGDLPHEQLVEAVRRMHEKGWGYKWSRDIASRLVLRSHTTAVSARLLALRPKPPFRAFVLSRVYRPDVVDARHLPEFHQLDGIAVEEGMSFRGLLGLLKEIFERIGIRDVKFKPAYFPFTEPSAEVYVRIGGQWIEVAGSGMIRPEILEAFGVDAPVAAWGMGVERLAMALLGINDIRLLYARDVDYLRRFPVNWRLYTR
ncbi:phenylalanyl-tRNA synthetase, alpha subunit [Pyrolobus fumarii 1A]|uniref:Phenylalanine--tRNA ligase alpha subunit n=1 Tax=Pyrolobus fumarii (strain DSM 11204 / 1A) TaxID=694429 RepID=G0EDD4_PYRF1|nr:phenylalanine--tRNA ligase subunit alpha [Pyrolobus fumarii]AEM38619.1 phenylalanyl-tRNA synthetase, alpha subunit [Pyrolobus fumarii 1A]